MGRYTGNSGLFTMAEFKNRGVIKLAPDALVFISGNFGTSVIAPVSGATQKIDFQDGVSSISVQNNIDPPGSSTANIEITTPIYNEKSNYWVSYMGDNGQMIRVPYFVPMMEVKIFFKGRFMVGEEPKMYPAFWGFIVNVDQSYSGGVHKISLQCADMLHWWQYVNEAFHPNVASDVFTGGKQGLTVWKSRYDRSNAFEIIYSLCTNSGMKNFTVPEWLGKSTPSDSILSTQEIKDVWIEGIMGYWNKRFKNQVNLLKMYGAKGDLLLRPGEKPKPRPDLRDEQNGNSWNMINDANKGAQSTSSLTLHGFNVDDFVNDFNVYGVFSDIGNLESAEYLTKLDVATQVKQKVEYEFFQDVNGNFIFKPPFYNLNTKNMLPYRIKPHDIINYSSAINSEEIVTALQVQVSINQHFQNDDWVNHVGYHVDMDLTKRYGERFRKESIWYLSGGSEIAWALAAGHLSKMNVKAFTGTLTMPGRPEIRLGYPVYIEHEDKFYYVTSINHSFDYGGSFTTSLSLNAPRPKTFGRDRDGRVSVQKNKMYKLSKRFNVGSDEEMDPNKTYDQIKAGEILDPNKKLEQLNRDNNFIKSTALGKYDIVDAPDNDKFDRATIQVDSVPYTDEEGYKVIGSFRYGRGIILTPGKPLDEAATSNSKDSLKNTAAKNQAQAITNIKSSVDEGAAMSDYFKGTFNADIEAAIPLYLKEILSATDANTINLALTNAADNGALDEDTEALLLGRIKDDSPVGGTGVSPTNLSGNIPFGVLKGAGPARDTTIARIKTQWSSQIDKAVTYAHSLGYTNVTSDLLVAMVAQESYGNPNAVSHAGAVGLLQLMPETAKGLGVKDRNDPQQNLNGGAKYIGELLKRTNGNVSLALGGYNAGPYSGPKNAKGERIYYYLDHGEIPPYSETLKYVYNITATLKKISPDAPLIPIPGAQP